jgi:hypothetical protein
MRRVTANGSANQTGRDGRDDTGHRRRSAMLLPGQRFTDLVHLGNHPEVGICISCVHFLRRRARDKQATVMRQTLRGAAESVRGQVMARGWHQRPVIGPALQWLNRHLPW